MTTEQEHLITLLFVKYGGYQAVVDTWLFEDDKFSTEELEAVNVWLEDKQAPKPLNLTVEGSGDMRFISLDFPLDIDWPPNAFMLNYWLL